MIKRLPFYLFLAAFCIRLLYLCQLSQSPFFYPVKGLDPSLYHSWALSILKEGWLGKEVFKAMPLYPYLLAIFYALSWKNLFLVYLFQLLVGSLNCFLLYRLGRQLGGISLGLVSAFFLAFSGISIFYEAMLVPTTTISLFLLLTFIVLSNATSLGRWILSGLLWGLTALAHAGILLWSPFVILWVFWGDRSRALSKKGLMLTGCFLALCLTLSISLLHNFLVAGEGVLMTAHGGVNFFIGNNAKATGQFHSYFSRYTSADQLFQQSKKTAEKEVGHPLTDGESSHYWFRKGMEFIQKDPVVFLKLLGRKWSFFWNAYEIPDVEDFYSFRKEFPILNGAPFQSAFLCPLALFGIFVSLRSPKRFFLLYGILFSMVGGLLLFFVNSRYRTSLLPFLALFAGYGCLQLVALVKNRRPRALLVSLFILFHLVLWTETESFSEERGIGYYNTGVTYLQAGLFEKALQELKQALVTTQDEGMVRFALGNAYFGQQNYKKAAESFQEALRDHPDFTDAYFNLGVTYMKLHQDVEARRALHHALQLDPTGVDIRRQLDTLDGKVK